MSSSEIIWVNRTLAMLARLHRIRCIRPVWAADDGHKYRLTVETGGHSVSTLIDIDSVREGFRGDEALQSSIIRELSGLMRTLATAGVDQTPSANQ